MILYGDKYTPYGVALSSYGNFVLPPSDSSEANGLPFYESSATGTGVTYEASAKKLT